MFVCPKCKGPLRQYHCAQCQTQYPEQDGIPCFLGPTDSSLRDLYDDIYSHHTDVWTDQGRSAPFREYMAALVSELPHNSVLEIGCGEGALLATLPGKNKYGIDPSMHALRRARQLSHAICAAARCEQLPLATSSIDLVVAVGVMEHFEDADAATEEIARVLAPHGHYAVLIQTDMTRAERIGVKMRELLYPRFRPIATLKWLRKKLLHRIVQPFRKSYTAESVGACLQRHGLRVQRTITKRSDPSAPLAGAHVVVLIASKNGLEKPM